MTLDERLAHIRAESRVLRLRTDRFRTDFDGLSPDELTWLLDLADDLLAKSHAYQTKAETAEFLLRVEREWRKND